uniref:Uncharacterized protein n=1 Tax=Arundo donax TaxID=35708 RepID=A0A0A8Y402_ARUDO
MGSSSRTLKLMIIMMRSASSMSYLPPTLLNKMVSFKGRIRLLLLLQEKYWMSMAHRRSFGPK